MEILHQEILPLCLLIQDLTVEIKFLEVLKLFGFFVYDGSTQEIS